MKPEQLINGLSTQGDIATRVEPPAVIMGASVSALLNRPTTKPEKPSALLAFFDVKKESVMDVKVDLSAFLDGQDAEKSLIPQRDKAPELPMAMDRRIFSVGNAVQAGTLASLPVGLKLSHLEVRSAVSEVALTVDENPAVRVRQVDAEIQSMVDQGYLERVPLSAMDRENFRRINEMLSENMAQYVPGGELVEGKSDLMDHLNNRMGFKLTEDGASVGATLREWGETGETCRVRLANGQEVPDILIANTAPIGMMTMETRSVAGVCRDGEVGRYALAQLSSCEVGMKAGGDPEICALKIDSLSDMVMTTAKTQLDINPYGKGELPLRPDQILEFSDRSRVLLEKIPPGTPREGAALSIVRLRAVAALIEYEQTHADVSKFNTPNSTEVANTALRLLRNMVPDIREYMRQAKDMFGEKGSEIARDLRARMVLEPAVEGHLR